MTVLCVLHNFICYRDPHELREFGNISQSYDDCFGVAIDVPQPALGGAYVSVQEKNQAEVFRDNITKEMWMQYQGELAH